MSRRIKLALCVLLVVSWAAPTQPAAPEGTPAGSVASPLTARSQSSSSPSPAPQTAPQGAPSEAAPLQPAPHPAFPPEGVPAAACAAGRTLRNIPVLQCGLRFEERDYTYYVYVPPIYDGRTSLPAVLLLHGKGGSGLDSISAWKKRAEADGFVLLAPTLPSNPALEPKMGVLLHTLLASALRERKIDYRRIYLFGHSMGGFYAFDAALLDPETYAAVAVHAAVIDPEYDSLVERARRKVPFAIYVGDRDPYFPLDRTRRTRDLLLAAGFDVQYVELLHHDHDYAAVADNVNELAWHFFRQHSLR
jgi:pimeloyl-ACP methyl ester carboxylesterase